ncbi:MAG: hypothetical protein GXO75_18765 [Calditrichaeota bacterium]|nr:hypothetical protein [Calditrichota bacterium]
MKKTLNYKTIVLLLAVAFIVNTNAGADEPDSTTTALNAPADSLKMQQVVAEIFCFDSTFYQGSNYGSFADVFDWMPGAYFFNRGSVGQPAYGFLFSGNKNSFVLEYDGLVLNDPLTGMADLNLLPTESVGSMKYGGVEKRDNRFLPTGQTLRIRSRDMASLPIKSRVGYRTGTGYDDNDVRLGIQPSPQLKINAGGLLKNYAGTTVHSKYRAQKVNVKIERSLGKAWNLGYVFLMNKFDLDVPFAPGYVSPIELSQPHQKDVRYDHGLSIANSKFHSFFQLTNLHREFYGYRHSVVDQVHDVTRLRSTSEYAQPLGFAKLNVGLNWQLVRLNSKDWGQHTSWELAGLANISNEAGEKIFWNAGAKILKARDFGPFVLPELRMHYAFNPKIKSVFWLNRQEIVPSLEARYVRGPFAQGNKKLETEIHDQFGIGLEGSNSRIKLFAAASLTHVQNEIALDPDKMTAAADTSGLAGYCNEGTYWRSSLDARIDLKLFSDLHLVSKIKLFKALNTNSQMTNLPVLSAFNYVQFSGVFFQGDLDARIRVGAEFLSERFGPVPYYADYSPTTAVLNPVITPYLHGIFIIRDVTLFASLLNPLSLEYERVYGYPMPKAQLRWGFVWNFFD